MDICHGETDSNMMVQSINVLSTIKRFFFRFFLEKRKKSRLSSLMYSSDAVSPAPAPHKDAPLCGGGQKAAATNIQRTRY